MNFPITVEKAVELTGRSKTYWREGVGAQFTARDENGNVMVLIHLYTAYLESRWQKHTQVSDQNQTPPSRSTSPTKANAITKPSSSSPTLETFR
ncbi:hypothetical protein THIOSC15_2720018 [uncultured Thiomicrorhabdus sp.]